MRNRTELDRSLTPLRLFSIAFGSIVGIGWITLVGQWLQRAGPAGSAIGFGAGCAAVMLIALAYSEVALLIPEAGAEVAYAQVVFGPMVAFTVGWVLLLTYAAIIGFQMISVGWVLSTLWPALRGPQVWSLTSGASFAGELAAGLVAMVAITAVNLRAASLSASMQVVLMFVKIGVSVLFIGAALLRGDAVNLTAPFGTAAAGPINGTLWVFSISLLFFSGFNFLPQAIEERAASVTPRQIVSAMMLSLGLACAFYLLVVLATSMTLPVARLNGLDLPAASAFEVAFGSRLLRNVVLLAGLTGLVTSWNGTLFAAARMVMMLGRSGLLPEAFGRVSPTTHTPTLATAAVSLLATAIGLAGRAAVGPIVTVAAACIPLSWTVVTAAALVLRRRRPELERPFRVTWGPAVFSGGLCVSLLAFLIAAGDALGDSGARLGGSVLLAWGALGIAVRLATPSRSA